MADNENKAPPDQKCILLKSKNQQPTAAMEPRLLHRMTRIFEKNSKPKCDFGATAAAQNKAMNWFLLCSEHSETQLKTTIHCHLS